MNELQYPPFPGELARDTDIVARVLSLSLLQQMLCCRSRGDNRGG